jgi:uncharacterized protein
MSPRVVGALVGVIFGVTLSWTGLTSPEVIRSALLFESSYLFLVFGSGVATAFIGLRLLRARRARAVLTGEPVSWSVARPERRHIAGSLLFGIGWGISGACPGPIATQLGQGILWSVFTIVGVVAGITLYMRRQEPPVATGWSRAGRSAAH